MGRSVWMGWALLSVILAVFGLLEPAHAKVDRGGQLSTPATSTVSTVTPPPVVGASVRVTARVKAARLLVVDDKDRIIAIYSNTGVAEESSFRLAARRHAADGPALNPLPERVLSAYRRLEDRVDWSARGLVFSSR